MLVAIDGPAGAGKSTVARAVAPRSASPTSTPGRCTAASRCAGDARPGGALDIAFDGDRVLLDGEDVTDAIRTPGGQRAGVGRRRTTPRCARRSSPSSAR